MDGIKRIGRNRISIEFKSADHANTFLDLPAISAAGYIASIPSYSVSRMRVVREVPVEWSMEELAENLEIPNDLRAFDNLTTLPLVPLSNLRTLCSGAAGSAALPPLRAKAKKNNSRKRNTLIRMNNIKTGGGGPDYIPPDEVLDKVATLLGNRVDGFTFEYGGDAELVPEPTNCWVSANVIIADGGGSGSDFVLEPQIIKLDASFISWCQVLQNDVLNDAEDSGKCSAKELKKYLFTPRASGIVLSAFFIL
ncbi:uncharacterized protein LOC123663060 [Melitaea cinxia]|uniref:uncharacterized protein LOC123663060 n=1 Tax=Melitaea cinxia TaxID=113334 RepID=UPI001E272FE7|nr:uncharacterized protein LOC123663060 [Melitaea cinxia]